MKDGSFCNKCQRWSMLHNVLQYGIYNLSLDVYLHNAMSFFRAKLDDRLFIVASDDIPRTREMIGSDNDVVFINGKCREKYVRIKPFFRYLDPLFYIFGLVISFYFIQTEQFNERSKWSAIDQQVIILDFILMYIRLHKPYNWFAI